MSKTQTALGPVLFPEVTTSVNRPFRSLRGFERNRDVTPTTAFFRSRLATTRPESFAEVFKFAHLDGLALRDYDCYRWQFPELIVGVDPNGE
jgi:hypothetical protein